MATLKNTSIAEQSFVELPEGTDAQKNTSSEGNIRINTSSNRLETYTASGWKNRRGWTIKEDSRFEFPSYTASLVIHAESSSFEANGTFQTVRVYEQGNLVLNTTTPRSYRLTRLSQNANGFWIYQESNGYDVYGNQTAADNAQAYLESFPTGDMLILTTWDEPFNRRSQLTPVLTRDFGSKIAGYPGQTFRDMHVLISIKGSKRPIFEEHRTRYSNAIWVSAWLG